MVGKKNKKSLLESVCGERERMSEDEASECEQNVFNYYLPGSNYEFFLDEKKYLSSVAGGREISRSLNF